MLPISKAYIYTEDYSGPKQEYGVLIRPSGHDENLYWRDYANSVTVSYDKFSNILKSFPHSPEYQIPVNDFVVQVCMIEPDITAVVFQEMNTLSARIELNAFNPDSITKFLNKLDDMKPLEERV